MGVRVGWRLRTASADSGKPGTVKPHSDSRGAPALGLITRKKMNRGETHAARKTL